MSQITEFAKQRTATKKIKQNEYIALRAQGMSHSNACKEIGRSRRAVDLWRKEEEEFARRLQIAVTEGRDPDNELRDFTWRRRYFFGHSTPWHHQQMIDAIEATGDKEVTLIIAPPESAKTTMLADLTTDTLAHDPNFRTCFITAGQVLAKKIANQVKNRLTDTNLFGNFIDTYGPFKPASRDDNKPWSMLNFTVAGASHDEKESSVEALGVGSSLYGSRFNRIIFDDAQELKKGILAPPTDGVLTQFHQMAGSRLVKGAGMFMLGSRLDQGDIYEKMLEEQLYHHLFFIEALYWKKDMSPAYITKEEMFTGGKGTGKKLQLVPGIEEEITSYWPEVHSLHDLALTRDLVEEETWSRAYMQRPNDVAAQSFTDGALNRAKDRTGERALRGRGVNILSVDPAFAGWSGWVGAECDGNSLRTTYIEEVRNLGNTDGFAAHLDNVCAVLAGQNQRPEFILVEADFYANLHDDSRIEGVAQKWGATLEPHETRNNRKDQVIGITRMPSSFLSGELSIPYQTDGDRIDAKPLLTELKKWRPDVLPRHLKQNLVMALWFAWRFWVERIRDTYSPPAQPVGDLPAWLRAERPVLLEGLR